MATSQRPADNTRILEIEHLFLPLAQLLAGTSQCPAGQLLKFGGEKRIEHTAGFLLYSPYRVARGKNEDWLYFGYSSDHVTLSRKDRALVGVGRNMDWSIPGKTIDRVLRDGFVVLVFTVYLSKQCSVTFGGVFRHVVQQSSEAMDEGGNPPAPAFGCARGSGALPDTCCQHRALSAATGQRRNRLSPRVSPTDLRFAESLSSPSLLLGQCGGSASQLRNSVDGEFLHLEYPAQAVPAILHLRLIGVLAPGQLLQELRQPQGNGFLLFRCMQGVRAQKGSGSVLPAALDQGSLSGRTTET
ncbi:hypothetical protein Anapl_09461 [Anas platyrhynchos]|uniref:Uncharacterized protein n=1 Tax=Anas platyrhynchos TaxID=8839 RepID=R0LAA9_ANAPL|nr:hypothetical protein Anapl_09461 [Anas platyrhynchos]